MLDDLINDFCTYLLIDKNYSKNTIDSYRNDLIMFDKCVNKNINSISDNDIKVYLEKEDSGSYNSILKPVKYTPLKKKTELGTKNGMVITKQVVKKNTIDNYRLRIWLSDSSKSASGNYAVEININAIAK